MISVEEMFYRIRENEPYPIDGASDDFFVYIMDLDIPPEIKMGILYRFNSAIAESRCRGISSTLSAVVGADRDTVYNQTIERYRKNMIKSAIKYRTKRGLKMKKYKPKFDIVEASRMGVKPHDWLVRFGNVVQVFSDESFNELFEKIGGCEECICHDCDKKECHDDRCYSCDVYSLKTSECIMSCETCVFRCKKYSTMCKQCYNHSNWQKPMYDTAEPHVIELEFNDSNKSRVFRTLSELQNNVYPTTDTLDKPVIVVPKDSYEMRICIDSIITIEDGVIKSFRPITQEEDQNGSI